MLFLNYKTYVVEDKGRRRGTGGQRVIYTTHTPAWDAKNRAGLPEELKLEYGSIASLFGAATRPKRQATPQPATSESGNGAQQEAALPSAAQEDAADPPPAEPVDTEEPAFLGPLRELMQRDEVSEYEVQQAVHRRGYYPADTPLANYDPQFVAGKLVAHWGKVKELIDSIRQEVLA